MAQTDAAAELYSLDFNDADWEELFYTSFDPFTFAMGEPLTRGQWMALGEMALGKAERIDRGDYQFMGEEGVDQDLPVWSAQLRRIAATIFATFPPGNGRSEVSDDSACDAAGAG